MEARIAGRGRLLQKELNLLRSEKTFFEIRETSRGRPPVGEGAK